MRARGREQPAQADRDAELPGRPGVDGDEADVPRVGRTGLDDLRQEVHDVGGAAHGLRTDVPVEAGHHAVDHHLRAQDFAVPAHRR